MRAGTSAASSLSAEVPGIKQVANTCWLQLNYEDLSPFVKVFGFYSVAIEGFS